MRLFVLFGLLACREQEKIDITESGNIIVDADNDGYTAEEDCDDFNADSNPGATELCDGIDNNCDGQADEGVTTMFYADSDGDGFGNPDISTNSCEAPAGYVTNGSDCDDTEGAAYPSADELCDGIDNDCNGEVDEELDIPFYVDTDGDGFGDDDNIVYGCDAELGLTTIGGDCDDSDPSISPIANEICDGIDNNCNEQADEGVTTAYYLDGDDDGFGDANSTELACAAPENYVDNSLDCDDLDSQINPNATESCDTVDNDCDGEIDELGSVGASVWYEDGDEDGYGDPTSTQLACSQPTGYVDNSSDCDDNNNLFNPSMSESCNGFDDDCDGQTDEADAIDASTWYADADGDGFGNLNSTTTSCSQPAGYTSDSTDCDDTDSDTNPAAAELCNGEDDNCDGQVDGADAIDSVVSYMDADGDGFGDNDSSTDSCSVPAGYVLYNNDCDDDNPSAHPNGTEVCDQADNNCDGVIDEDSAVDAITWYADGDTDGYGDASSTSVACTQPAGFVANADDCDDTQTSISPDGVEICDEIDNDCNGAVDDNATDGSTWYIDHDDDGYGSSDYTLIACEQPVGYLATDGDCNDMASEAYPGAAEVCDEIDNDCDGEIDEDGTLQTWYLDADGDGFGDSLIPLVACAQPVGYVDDNTDCNDSDVDSYPGAPEICDGLDNDCDGSVTEIGSASCPAESCLDVITADPTAATGLYYLDPQASGSISENYCNMDIDGGGWTLFLKAYNGDATRFYHSASHTTLEDDSTINESNPGLDFEDYKSMVYTTMTGTQLMAMDLSQYSQYAYADINNGSQTILQHLLDAQDGRWEGGANGCGILLDNYYASNGSSTMIGSIPITQIGLMCSDDQTSGGWSNHSDDSVYFGFYPNSACGDNVPWHHSGIGKWADDGGDDVYENANAVCSSSSGIALFLR